MDKPVQEPRLNSTQLLFHHVGHFLSRFPRNRFDIGRATVAIQVQFIWLLHRHHRTFVPKTLPLKVAILLRIHDVASVDLIAKSAN